MSIQQDDAELDPAARREAEFELLRRFVDEWLLSVKDASTGFVADTTAPGCVEAGQEFQPCTVGLEPVAYETPHGLFQSPNRAFNKLATMLAYLIHELGRLIRQMEREVYPMLLMFGEGLVSEREGGGALGEGATQVALAKTLPAFRTAALALTRLEAVTAALLAQLGAASAEHMRKATILKGDCAESAYRMAAAGLGVLVRVEQLTVRNQAIASAFAMYQRMLQAVAAAPDDDFPPDALAHEAQLREPLHDLQERIVGRGAFSAFLGGYVSRGTELVAACSAPSFLAAASSFLRQEIGETQERISSGGERAGDREGLVGLLALGVVYARLCNDEAPLDSKTLRVLVDVHMQVPLLPVYSEVMMQPVGLLSAYLPPSADAFLTPAVVRQAAAARRTALERLDEGGPADAQQLAQAIAAWEAQMGAIFAAQRSNEALLTKMGGALLRGVSLAAAARERARLLLGLHAEMGAPLPRATLRALGLTLALAAGVAATFARRSEGVAAALPHLVTHLKSGLSGVLAAARAGAGAQIRTLQGIQPRFSSKAAREKTAASLAEAMVAAGAGIEIARGPASRATFVAMSLCIDALEATEQVPGPDVRRAREALQGLEVVADLRVALQEAASCSFLYFHQDLFAPLLSQIWQCPEEAHKVPHLLAAYQDAHYLIDHVASSRVEAHKAYDEELLGVLSETLMQPLVRELEADLRLHAHARRQTGDSLPTAAASDYSPILHLPTLRLLTRSISIRQYVAASLSETFYNHAALALSDSRAYCEMSSLAQDKYSLPVAPPRLRGTTPEQGLDVMDVVRNMRAFAASYAYNLPAQLFVERPGAVRDVRQLNTLTLADTHAALRAHGPALADAAAHQAARFLAQRLLVLSQSMQGDAVRARLANEAATAEEGQGGRGKPYTVEAAERLSADLRRLGVAADGGTYLDYFRRLLTEIGNVLGFVRMVRHSGLHVGTAAAALVGKTVPDAALGFRNPRAPPSAASTGAVETLRAVLQELQGQAQGGPDYLVALVRVFTEQLRSTGNVHLQPFYVAVPALTLNAVEGALLAKEQLQRRRHGVPEAGFTDDGFALGLAYVLKVLGQTSQFEALQWFASVRKHSAGEHERAMNASGNSAPATRSLFGQLTGALPGAFASVGDTDGGGGRQALALELSRLASFSAEFELLQDTLAGAQAFFGKA